MLEIVRKSQFKKDFKKLLSAGKDLNKLAEVLRLLQIPEELPTHNRDHNLTGEYKAYRECHITGDSLLIYSQTENELILYRTGSHSELFR